MNADELRRQVEYYRDLGVKELYRRPVPASAAEPDAIPEPVADTAQPPASSEPRLVMIPSAGVSAPQPADLPPMAPKNETLFEILQDMGDCRRCRLHEGRNKIVFGVGDEKASLVFVGEGPGADEDEQGLPFVGRAGQLLTQMIENTAKKEGIPLQRADVYICNVVKCRPPGNRTPEPDEMEICGQFLYRQLIALKPKAICALGGTAARALTGRKEGVTKMRGKWFQWREIPVMITYHPSYLLRPYNQDAKREAWEDLKKALHFVYG
ncbi:MAG TPA: uracil-DNA glycosylase family protein [Bryobacteraceae bacterium]|jgi:DNA polymerase|nr:uracil-DNA glycosylase family protein [Bryobacteraceae bacterium]